MKDLIQQTKAYWFFLLIWWAIAGTMVALFSKSDLHLFINQFHHPILDVFFKYITYLGDGLFAGITLFIILWFNLKKGLLAALGFGFSALITQTLKRVVFYEVLRPSKYFEGVADLHFVPGVDLHAIHSFPSGHSTAAFTLFTALVIIYHEKRLLWLFFSTALLAAFSRVYLSQHFVIDILFGSIIGSLTALFFMSLEKKISWNDRGLKDILKSRFP